MVTVLVFAVPAFAVDLGESDPSGPGGADVDTGTGDNPPLTGKDNPAPENIGGESDPQAPGDTIGGLATLITTHSQEFGAAAGHHVIEATGSTPGECVQEPAPCLAEL